MDDAVMLMKCPPVSVVQLTFALVDKPVSACSAQKMVKERTAAQPKSSALCARANSLLASQLYPPIRHGHLLPAPTRARFPQKAGGTRD